MSLVVVGGGSKIPFRLTSRLSVETETPARHQKIRSILWFVSKSTDGAPLALVRVAGVALVVLVGRFVKANARHGRRLPVAAVHEPQRVPAPAKKKYRLGKQFPNLWVKLPPGGRSTQALPPLPERRIRFRPDPNQTQRPFASVGSFPISGSNYPLGGRLTLAPYQNVGAIPNLGVKLPTRVI